MTEEKYCRCIKCNKEFTEKEIGGFSACPNCGDKGIPALIKDDVNIKINWHELRILSLWAERWAGHIEKECPQSLVTVACIAKRIERQFPDKTPLTLSGEIGQLRDDKTLGDIKTNIPEGHDKIAEEFN